MFRQVGVGLSSFDLNAAFRWCETHCDGPHGANLRPIIAMRWAQLGGGLDALAWLGSAPAGTERDGSLPGVFQGRLTVSEAGLHRLTDGKLSTVAAAGSADPRESGDVIATEEILRPVAEATSGTTMWLDNGGRTTVPRLAMVRPGRSMAGSGWLGLKANNSYRVKEIERFPLFGSLISLALLLALISLMWYREGR